ncbi:hypothetical protein IscW_ISCW016354 [Ixodes scapularis]|uniref:C2H2-type domain-containing protein n=2 Tax=Ixodes TaxID=6944 RepID=B7P2G0_IXOSC|nr:hypothetical protein IscW_ISCW016354 [Ixodes scapularis]|eukprot:XP_002402334.1 hypothetical protein IscW_ISCW016354 [Ixodes scapularis]
MSSTYDAWIGETGCGELALARRGKPETAPCPYCFAHLSVKSLSRHKKDMHGSQKRVHKCSVCDAKLTRLDNLRRHMMLRHRPQKSH